MRHRRTILAGALLAAATASPSAATAQTPFRAACDLVTDAVVSETLGMQVTAERSGFRTQCLYLGDGGGTVTTWLNSDATLSMFASMDGVEPLTVGGLEGIWWPSQSRLILSLPDGGVLDVSSSGQAGDPRAATVALAEAMLSNGPVSAIPPDEGPAEPLYLEGSMCDLLSPEEVNAITGGTFGPLDIPPEENDPNCTLQEPDGFIIYVLGTDYGHSVDAGTYTSEDLTVAGRASIWEPDREFLTVDGGDGITLLVGFSSNEPDPDAHREQAIAIAEAILPRLGTEAPPVPETAECTVSLDELSRMIGLEIVNAFPFGPVCFYGTADATTQQGALIGFLAGDDPAAALEAASLTSEVEPTPGDVDGHAALVTDAPEGAALAVDLDGLPGGDGQVLLVVVGGIEGDRLAITTEIVRYLIANM